VIISDGKKLNKCRLLRREAAPKEMGSRGDEDY
jgi:hypothetical protein